MAIPACMHLLANSPPFNLCTNPLVPQICIFGPEGSGKSTLLYKLKIQGWKKDVIIRDMKSMKRKKNDPAYHYEELKYSTSGAESGKHGVWEIPHNFYRLGLSEMFYKFLQIRAVLYVVDARPVSFEPNSRDEEEWFKKMQEASAFMHKLFNEDELKNSAFILVLNVNEDSSKASSGYLSVGLDSSANAEEDPYETAIKDMLGVPLIMATPATANRFGTVRLSAAEVTSTKWIEILGMIRDISRAIHPDEAST
mmetsp:Transcript_97488/g.172630  ORF Transcript_97488/g.172630 Transcript_97488/m.172630 type:complete len:253 (+) Transcript_97488:83-841(+)